MARLTEDEREIYARDNINLTYHFVYKYKTPFDDEQSLLSEAMLGLTQALRYFDKSKGFQFTTYASRCIIRNIKIYQAEQARKGINKSYDALLENKDGEEVYKQEPASEEDIESESVLKVLIDDVLAKESRRNADLVRLYLTGKSYSEVGRIHGLSKMRVYQIVKGLLNEIKTEYIAR